MAVKVLRTDKEISEGKLLVFIRTKGDKFFLFNVSHSPLIIKLRITHHLIGHKKSVNREISFH